jgi:hypothetical protein
MSESTCLFGSYLWLPPVANTFADSNESACVQTGLREDQHEAIVEVLRDKAAPLAAC